MRISISDHHRQPASFSSIELNELRRRRTRKLIKSYPQQFFASSSTLLLREMKTNRPHSTAYHSCRSDNWIVSSHRMHFNALCLPSHPSSPILAHPFRCVALELMQNNSHVDRRVAIAAENFKFAVQTIFLNRITAENIPFAVGMGGDGVGDQKFNENRKVRKFVAKDFLFRENSFSIRFPQLNGCRPFIR